MNTNTELSGLLACIYVYYISFHYTLFDLYSYFIRTLYVLYSLPENSSSKNSKNKFSGIALVLYFINSSLNLAKVFINFGKVFCKFFSFFILKKTSLIIKFETGVIYKLYDFDITHLF